MSACLVGTDAVRPFRPRGIAAGARRPQPEVVPMGTIHAVDPDSRATLCGRPVAHVFDDWPWDQVRSGHEHRCPDCAARFAAV